MQHPDISSSLRQRIERVAGQPVAHARRVERGYSLAHRFVVTLADGTSLFAKAASTPDTAAYLRREQARQVYKECKRKS